MVFVVGSSYVKLFGKAQVDVNLSLGQFNKVTINKDNFDNSEASEW